MSGNTPSLTLVRWIKAPPSRVFEAITTPNQMLRWWGPDAGPTLSVEADVRPGGRFSIVFRTSDGQEHNPTGMYREVVPESRLVFSWEWPGRPEAESLVTFILAPSGEGTRLTLIHEHLPDEPARQSHQLGWRGWLDQLAQFLREAK